MTHKLLVVEDHPVNRRLMQTLLTRAGYQVVLAEDGAEGVSVCVAEKPALILMDLLMPVMDGFEAIARIKEHADFADLPVIAVTADESPGIQDRVLAAGFVAYLKKPFTKDQVYGLVNQYLGETN